MGLFHAQFHPLRQYNNIAGTGAQSTIISRFTFVAIYTTSYICNGTGSINFTNLFYYNSGNDTSNISPPPSLSLKVHRSWALFREATAWYRQCINGAHISWLLVGSCHLVHYLQSSLKVVSLLHHPPKLAKREFPAILILAGARFQNVPLGQKVRDLSLDDG